MLSEGACVLVIDVGGGTMDMTVFVFEDGFARQLLADDGSFDAGKKVDKYFMEYLVERVGGQRVWDDFLEREKGQKGALFTYSDRECSSLFPVTGPLQFAHFALKSLMRGIGVRKVFETTRLESCSSPTI